MTKPEQKFSSILTDLGYVIKNTYSSFDPPYSVYCQVSTRKFRFDFVLPSANIIFEVDGDYWHSTMDNKISPVQLLCKIQDVKKNQYVMQSGWNIMRFSAQEIESKEFPQKLQLQILKTLDI